jgi:hypothetical protein
MQPEQKLLPSASRVAVLRTAGEVRAIMRSGLRRRVYIALEIPGIPRSLASQLESQFNESLHECGCALGAKLAVLGLLAPILWHLFGTTGTTSSWLAVAFQACFTMFAGGGLGKFMGVGLARLQTRRIAARLMSFVENQDRGEGHVHMHEMGG